MANNKMTSKLPRERYKLLMSLERLMEGPMIFLGFVWFVLLMIELIRGLPPILERVSLIIWGIFIIDFLLKFILAPAKEVFLRRNWLTAVSLLIPALRVFRVLRILRVLRGVRLVKVIGTLNRSLRSLGSTMSRRGFGYVVALSSIIIAGGAAGMLSIERGHVGFQSYGQALWWTAMRVITAGSDYWPVTAEGRIFAFLLSVFGYAVFGYVTATLATFFIGRDAEEKKAPIASANQVQEIKKLLQEVDSKIEALKKEAGNI